MYIVIVGGGRVGYYLAKALIDEGHEIVIVEKNARYCDIINEEMGSVCIKGDGCEAVTLAEIGTGRADMLVAVTGDDEDNLVACQVAKHKFNVPRTIARIRNPANEDVFKKLGIDVAVSSTNIILEQIEKVVPTHPLTHLLTIEDKGLEIIEVKIPAESSSIGKPIRELPIPKGSRLALICPLKGKHHVPTASTTLKAGDRVLAITRLESEEELRAVLRGE